MAKYGSFKYGAAKYGYTNPGRRLSWGLIIDWDENGGWITGYNEAYGYNENGHKMFALNTKAGRQYFINSSGNNFQAVDPSQMQVQLYDIDARYDPYNTSGALYQKILPGKKFKLIVQDEATQTQYPVMIGNIQDIRPNYGSVSTVTITGRNKIEELKNTPVLSNGVYTNEQYDTGIGVILSLAGWTDGTRIDSDVSDSMPYWWLSGKNAFDEINDLTNASRGLFFVSNDGYATYYSNINSPDPTTTFIDTDALLSYGIRVPTPWEAIKNYVRVYARSRTASSTTLWTLSSKPLIAAGASITIWAEFNTTQGANAPATIVTTPVATTDYTANASEDGSGTNLTSNISIAITNYATTSQLVITNTGGTGAYLTLMQLRGTLIKPDDYTYAEDSDANSIALYKKRSLVIKTNWIQTVNEAIDYAGVMVDLLSTPKQFPRFVVRDTPAKQFAPDIFDIVAVDFDSHHVTGNFRVGYMEHNWVINNGDVVDTTFYLEPNIAGNISGTWIFPAKFGLSTKF